MSKLSFSGHDTFTCKPLWLKKGVDFVLSNKKFTEEQAVVDLGVGKNMVSAIRFWLKAFGLTDENDKLLEIGKLVFSNPKHDPYLEANGTLWLLHYQLIKTERASLYSLVFNQFRRLRPEFQKEQLHLFLKRYCDENNPAAYNANTIETDIGVFIKSYLRPDIDDEEDIEDSYAGILTELDMLSHFVQFVDSIDEKTGKKRTEKVDWYKIERDYRPELPWQIFLYSILDNYPEQTSITLQELEIGHNSPGSVFVLNKEGLIDKIEELIKHNPKKVVFDQTAGNQVIQFKGTFDKNQVLHGYYNN
jgi:hypothetical protein